MSVSLTSTIARSVTFTNHGKRPFGSREAMDVHRDPLLPPRPPSPLTLSPRSQLPDTNSGDFENEQRSTKIRRLDGATDIATKIDAPLPPKPPQQAETGPPNAEPEPDGAFSATQQVFTEEVQSKMSVPEVAPLVANPAFTQNVLSLYDLDPLVATVARTDPVTGEKINKMRKSYEGQLKSLGLQGRNKSVRHDETKGMGLAEMAAWPEEEWQNQKVRGKEVSATWSEARTATLEKAMQMQPGRVLDNDYWEDLLGLNMEKVKSHDQHMKYSKVGGVSKSGTQLPNGVRPHNPATAAPTGAQPAEPARSRRNVKKRRYDDGSFEGYGEGYVDDEMDAGNTSGDSQRTRASAGHRKRQKTKVRYTVELE